MPATLNNTPKYVVSTTLDKVDWKHSMLIKGDLTQAIARLKQQLGKNIGIGGSPTLVRSLLQDDLLDELTLLVHPGDDKSPSQLLLSFYQRSTGFVFLVGSKEEQ